MRNHWFKDKFDVMLIEKIHGDITHVRVAGMFNGITRRLSRSVIAHVDKYNTATGIGNTCNEFRKNIVTWDDVDCFVENCGYPPNHKYGRSMVCKLGYTWIKTFQNDKLKIESWNKVGRVGAFQQSKGQLVFLRDINHPLTKQVDTKYETPEGLAKMLKRDSRRSGIKDFLESVKW